MITIGITIQAGNWGDPDQMDALIAKAVNAAEAGLGWQDVQSELSVLLTDDAQMATINGQWRGKPVPTNVLSFPAAQLTPGGMPGALLGDIALAHETVEREAAIAGKRFDDHLFHLVVHGMLHLGGHDHEVDSDAETMENLEKAILADNGIDDPYVMPDP